MNGIEKLTGRILEDAEAQVKSIIGEAEDKADVILNNKRSEAEGIYQDKIRRGKLAAEQRVERLGSVAKLEAKKLILGTKQEMVSNSFDLALDKLTKLPERDYIKLLSSLAVSACKTGTEEILFSENDKNKYGKKIVETANTILSENGKKAELTCSDQTVNIKGGIVVKEGNIEMNCSFETIIRLKHDELATEVSGVLFK